MDSPSEEKKPRKPLLSVEAEPEEKARFKRAAKARHMTVSALARLLLHAEADRLGIK